MQRKISYSVIMFFLFFVSTFSVAQTPDIVHSLDGSLQQAVDRAIVDVKPALVRIHVVTVYDDQGRKSKYESAGSGVIITEKGHVITNHHVAGKAKRIVCTLYSKEEVDADLVATDPL